MKNVCIEKLKNYKILKIKGFTIVIAIILFSLLFSRYSFAETDLIMASNSNNEDLYTPSNKDSKIYDSNSLLYENKIHKPRTFEKISASVGIYGEVDFDLNYNYNFSNNTSSYKYKEEFNNPLMVNNHKHTVGSQNFLNNSYFGLNINYKNMYVNLEVGILDYIRKFTFSYFFNSDLNHGITIGKTDTLAYSSIGQSELINSFYGKSILEGYGALNSNNRRLQFRYTYKNFNIALIMPYLFEGYDFGNDRAHDLYKNDQNEFLGFSYIPRIETSIDLGKSDKNVVSLFGSYAAYVFKEDMSYLNKESKNTDIVHAYSLGLKEKLEFAGNGIFDFLIWAGANLYLNNYINNSNANPIVGYIYKNDSGFDKNFLPNFRHNNVYSFGAATSLSYEFLINKPYLKTVRPSIGVGYMGSYANGYSIVDNAISGYFNIGFFINDFFSITPEIGINHDLNNGINKWEGGNITAGLNAKFYF